MRMPMKRTALVVLAIFMLTLSACSKNGGSPAHQIKLQSYKVGSAPVRSAILEQGTHNIPLWLKYGAKDRTLVLFSSTPGLAPVNDSIVAEAKKLADERALDALFKMGDSNAGGTLYNPENTVTLAHRLGIVKQLYWVVPSFVGITEADVSGFKDALKKDYPGLAGDIDGLKLNGRVAEGVINKVPVKFMSLQDIPQADDTVLVDVDLSYFSALYRDEKSTRVLGTVSGFFRLLQDAGLNSDIVSIVTSNMDGRVPLKFRFIGLYLTSLLAKPEMLKSNPPELWTERAEAWRVEQKDLKVSKALYKGITKKFPADAATHYDLSDVSFRLGDLETCKKELDEAARIDRGYAIGYYIIADTLSKSGKTKEADSFLTAAKALR